MPRASSPPPVAARQPSVPPLSLATRALGALSTVLTLAMHLAVLLVFWVPWTWPLIALAVASYTLRMWAITAGYHRYFSHRSFRTSRPMQFFFAILATTSVQKGVLWWASHHRTHQLIRWMQVR